MSTDTGGESGYYTAERAHSLIREHYEETGRSPTRRDIGERDAAVGDDYYESGSVPSSWSGVVRAAGVPTPGEIVATHYRELYADRYPWQDSVVRTVRAVSEATGMSTSQTVHGLKDARESDDLDVMDGFEFAPVARYSGATKWRFQPVGGGEQ